MIKNVIKIGWSILALIICVIILLVERGGVKYEEAYANLNQEERLELQELKFTQEVSSKTECLLIVDSSDNVSQVYETDMKYILDCMRIAYDVVDLKKEEFPDLTSYKIVVLACTDLSLLKENVLLLCDWVEAGGRMMNTNTYELNNYFLIIARKMGVIDTGDSFVGVGGFKVLDDFMIGGNREFHYDEVSEIAINVQLNDDCHVYMESTENNIPLLWECPYGKGKFVTMNQSITGKSNRGILSAAYSLLEEVSIYPVINASAFYIDDFPAPIPEGDSEYITKEYNTSVSDFYTNIWWPTLLNWEEKYGIIHTGLIIEEYSDVVKAPFDKQKETDRFTFFGNMLLNRGGELGWHGYNHMPLCLDNFDYKGLFDSYEPWDSKEAMTESLSELQEFTSGLYPSQEFSVYVPPSNILSEEGRSVLKEQFPNIQMIASTYLVGDCVYTQEFAVASDGIVETPRITSGCNLDDYMNLMAFSELNFHYVQSHFLHPDDALDEDRGAAFGWDRLSEIFSEYLDYIYTSAPDIRNVTGSQMGTAVAQYDALSVAKEIEGNQMTVKLGGFSGDAYLMMRLNEKNIKVIKGGAYEHVTGNLYVLHAMKDTIVMTFEN